MPRCITASTLPQDGPTPIGMRMVSNTNQCILVLFCTGVINQWRYPTNYSNCSISGHAVKLWSLAICNGPPLSTPMFKTSLRVWVPQAFANNFHQSSTRWHLNWIYLSDYSCNNLANSGLLLRFQSSGGAIPGRVWPRNSPRSPSPQPSPNRIPGWPVLPL
jgi:hypothetical protein